MSSRNRFAPLGEPSSSKEQETRVPTTGATDQRMEDAPQAGPSSGNRPMDMGALKDSLPQPLSKEEIRALFYKRKAEFFEEERKKKSRQRSDPSTSVGRHIPSAASSQGFRKRTASSDEAENSSKRMKPDTAASATTAGASSSASALAIQKDTALSPWWAGIQLPKLPLLCIVQLGYLARMGSFDEDAKDWTFHLILDADQQQSPTMIMNFFSKGVKGKLNGQIEWCLGDFMNDDWMVADFKIERVADCAGDRRIYHTRILMACQTDEERARLICISLVARPKLRGHFDKYVVEPFAAIFTGRHPYDLRIWLLAPENVERFEERCLSFFTRYFERRTSPHSDLQEAHDVGLADGLKKPTPLEHEVDAAST